MSDKSAIEWTDATWNPVRGCTKIAPGCAHCYAETFAERFRGVVGSAYEQGFDPRIAPDQLTVPLKWKRPRRIFVNSMSDLFHESFDFDYIAAVFGIMAACADRDMGHTLQVLTKRPARAVEFFRWLDGDSGVMGIAQSRRKTTLHESVKRYLGYDHPDRPAVNLLRGWPLPNVWIGTSIANQHDADKNIPHLLQIPTVVRFLSCEPLIGPIEFSDVSKRADAVKQLGRAALNGIDWVIVGAESGHGARPCNVEWIRSIVAQCKAAGVPVFVKQLGAKPYSVVDRISHRHNPLKLGDGFWRFLNDRKGGAIAEFPIDLQVREFPNA